MDDPIVFNEGEYECSGDGWRMTVRVDSTITLSQLEPALKEMIGVFDDYKKSGAR